LVGVGRRRDGDYQYDNNCWDGYGEYANAIEENVLAYSDSDGKMFLQ